MDGRSVTCHANFAEGEKEKTKENMSWASGLNVGTISICSATASSGLVTCEVHCYQHDLFHRIKEDCKIKGDEFSSWVDH